MHIQSSILTLFLPILVTARIESKPSDDKNSSEPEQGPRATQIKQLIFGFLQGDISLEFPGEFEVPYGKCHDIEITYFELPNIVVLPEEGIKQETLSLRFDDVKIAANLECGVCVTIIWDVCTNLYPDINLTHVNFDVEIKAKLEVNETGNKILRLDVEDCSIDMDFEMDMGSEGFMGWVASTAGGFFQEKIEKGVKNQVTNIGCEMVEEAVYDFNRNINEIVIPKREKFKKIYYRNKKLRNKERKAKSEAENDSTFPVSSSVIWATLLLILAFFQ